MALPSRRLRARSSGRSIRVSVIFASPFQGYGLTVVVKHAGGVLTLYAGLESLQVARDDVVALGSVLGAAAADLYFELREQNRAVDPLEWLR